MTTFLGKYWPVRLLLWALAASLCFVVWPKLALWPKYSLIYHRSSAPIALYYDEHDNLMAWNYEANTHWSVAGLGGDKRPRFAFAGDRAIAMMDSSGRIRIVDIAPPHREREYAVPFEAGTPRQSTSSKLLMVTGDERFAVVQLTGGSKDGCVAVDLANQQVTDTVGTGRDAYSSPGFDEIEGRIGEQGQDSARPIYRRWRLNEQGQFVEVPFPKMPEQVSQLIYGRNRQWNAASASENDQLIVRARYEHVEVFAPGSNSAVSKFQALNDVWQCHFTYQDRRVITQTERDDIEVWDVQTGSRVAAKERWPPILRVLRIIAICGIAGCVIASVLAWKAESPRICLYDYVLAVTFWLIFRSADQFRRIEEIDEAIATANLMAIVIGVYWGVGPGPLWSRLGYSIPSLIPITMALTARLASETVYDQSILNKVYFHPVEIARQCSIPLISAMASCLATVPLTWFGYRVANGMDVSRPSRWKIHLDSVLALITGIAVCLGFFQLHLTAWAWRDQETTRYAVKTFGDKAEYAFEIFYMVALVAAPCGVVLAWLGLWQWTRWRTVVFAVVGGLAGLALVVILGEHLFWQVPKTSGYMVAIADVAAIFALPIATVSIPFVIARRAGYQWLRIDSATRTPPHSGG